MITLPMTMMIYVSDGSGNNFPSHEWVWVPSGFGYLIFLTSGFGYLFITHERVSGKVLSMRYLGNIEAYFAFEDLANKHFML